MAVVISPLVARDTVAPLLPSLPAAAMASEPSTAVLPLLSPILRQRVQFLSASSSEPWIRLLSYDASKAAKLVEIARSARLEPHPLSGEIEVDWDSTDGDVEIRYKRVDVETLQALVHVRDLDLVFRLVYCEGDYEGTTGNGSGSTNGNSNGNGNGNGWRVGEVSIPDTPHAFSTFGGHPSVAEAERVYGEAKKTQTNGIHHHHHQVHHLEEDDEDDDDDDYWARYDATPARTPAVKRSPAPASVRGETTSTTAGHTHSFYQAAEAAAEDAYFSQYDDVQPAMDNHDPDEEPAAAAMVNDVHAERAATVAATTTNGLQPTMAQALERLAGSALHAQRDDDYNDDQPVSAEEAEQARREQLEKLVHPRPASAASSNTSSDGSSAVIAKLEQSAGKREQSEFGVKQHVSRSIKSLYMLARASGIDREEFEQLVKTELDLLSMMED